MPFCWRFWGTYSIRIHVWNYEKTIQNTVHMKIDMKMFRANNKSIVEQNLGCCVNVVKREKKALRVSWVNFTS